jgi:hypothetical protein
MENPHEVEIVNRWQAADRPQQEVNGDGGSRKRPRRAIENTPAVQNPVQPQLGATPGAGRGGLNLRPRGRGGNKKATTSVTHSSRVIELTDENEEDMEPQTGIGSASFWQS